MNYTPFSTFTGTLPAGHQFTTAKLAHQVSTSGGQVVGLICPPDETGVTYIRPIADGSNAFTLNLAPQQGSGNNSQHNQVSEVMSCFHL